MTPEAKLYIEDTHSEYNVVKCTQHFLRHHNLYFPDADTKCKQISITVIADSRTELYGWYIDRMKLSGKISFLLPNINEDKATRELLFENAECYSIAEIYDIDKTKRRELTLEITAEKCTFTSNTNHSNRSIEISRQ